MPVLTIRVRPEELNQKVFTFFKKNHIDILDQDDDIFFDKIPIQKISQVDLEKRIANAETEAGISMDEFKKVLESWR